MISAVTNQGKVRFGVFDDTMIADILIDFCKRLIKSADRKIFLLLDNLRVHHAMVFKACIVKHADEIEVFYLSSYSLELNPVGVFIIESAMVVLEGNLPRVVNTLS